MLKMQFCWFCQRKLRLPYFSEITGPAGTPVRVHKSCKEGAEIYLHPPNINVNENEAVLLHDRSPKLAEE